MKNLIKIWVFLILFFTLSYGVFGNPVISNVQISRVFSDTALITWETDVAATSRVTYGKTTPPSINEDISDMTLEHSVLLTGLDSCSTYYFEVTSNDGQGSTTDNNGGSYYTFNTGNSELTATYSASDVPLTIPMNGTASSVIYVGDNMTIEDVDVTIGELLKDFVWTIRVYLIAPDNTKILLAKDQGEDISTENPNFEGLTFDDDAFYYMQDATIHPPYTGRFKPLVSLSHFYGKNAQGNWTLEITNIDTSRTATLNSWSIKFHYGYEYCSAHSRIESYQVTDACTGTGNGNNDGVIDAGESIQLGITLYNDGNVNLTSVSGTLTTSTSGVTVVNGSSSFPNIAKRAQGTSNSNFSFNVDISKVCSDTISFNLHITSSEKPSGWDVPLTLKIGNEPSEDIVLIDEDLAFGMPTTWTIIDGGDNDSAPEAVWTWTDQNPCSGELYTTRDISPPVSEPFMIVDSDCAGEYATQDEQLILPQLDFSNAGSAYLEFDHHFYSNDQQEVCYVDIKSSLTSNEWLNLWNLSLPPLESAGGHIVINITDYAAGANNVQIRFRYVDPAWGWWWVVDNIKVHYTPSYYCNMNRCCPTMTTPVITNITDDNLCSQTGITITFTSSSPATRHDLYVDGTLAQSNVTSPISYNPGDKNSHSYKIGAINYYEDCYIESSPSTFTDEDRTPGTPSAPTVTDVTPCSTNGVQISWGAVLQATYYDLLVDDTILVNNVTSPHTYEPGDNNSHNYKIRGRNDDCTGGWSVATSGTDLDQTPATPSTAPTVTDKDACQTNGVNITWSSVNGANAYDLRVDGTTVIENVTSPYTYTSGDNNQHSYEIRGKYVNSSPSYTCYGGWSPSQNGTDINDTPGAPSITAITDNDACATSGVTITFTAGNGATSHDLYKDGSIAVSNFTSGSTYQPADNASHNYVIRAKKNTCYNDSTGVAGTDVNDTPGQPVITGIVDVSACATSGIQINYTSGSGATSHDLYRDGSIVVTNYVSGATYQPGDNNSHNYVIRAKKNTCYIDSTQVAGTDGNDTPGTPTISSITDLNNCASSGVSITWGAVSGATAYDLYVDESILISNVTSPYTYVPSDGNNHYYQVRGKNSFCIGAWSASAMPSYTNEGGSGNRTSLITVTSDIVNGNANQLVDGNNTSSGIYFNPVSVVGRYVSFDFGSGASRVITEAKYYQGTSHTHGTWKWQGSNDGSSWTDIGGEFTLGGSTIQTITVLSGNANEYRYYRILGVSGTASAAPWIYEFEFKISGLAVGRDINYTPSAITIGNIVDEDPCQTSGIRIYFTGGEGADNFVLVDNSVEVDQNYTSGKLYNPGDNASHTYVIRAKKNTCYTDSEGYAGTDINNTPSPISLTASDNGSGCGILVSFSGGSGATQFDLYVDGVLKATSITSGYVYEPADSNSHNYVVRGINGSCYTDSNTSSASDPGCGVPPGEVGNGANFTWTANQTSQTFSWNSDPVADGYRVYRGVKAELGNLCDASTDFCMRYEGTNTNLDVTSDSPATIDSANRVVYYLIVAYNGAGEGTSGNATCGTRQINSTGNCP